jgi:hypothetical protein
MVVLAVAVAAQTVEHSDLQMVFLDKVINLELFLLVLLTQVRVVVVLGLKVCLLGLMALVRVVLV